MELPQADRALFPRVAYLIWVESLINVGCKFGPADLSVSTWNQLMVLSIERAFVDRLVQARRDKLAREDRAVAEGRQEAGVPPPGSTLFKTSRPFK